MLRLVRPSNDGKVSLDAFVLSSDDEASELKSISVWASTLTKPGQARELMGEKKAEYTLAAFLLTSAVRAVRPTPESDQVGLLDVVWDPLILKGETGLETPDTRPGAAGHAGITGLVRKDGIPNSRAMYKSLRSQLADLANKNLISIN